MTHKFPIWRQLGRIAVQQIGTTVLIVFWYIATEGWVTVTVPGTGMKLWVGIASVAMFYVMGLFFAVNIWYLTDQEYPLYDQRLWWKKAGVWVRRDK